MVKLTGSDKCSEYKSEWMIEWMNECMNVYMYLHGFVFFKSDEKWREENVDTRVKTIQVHTPTELSFHKPAAVEVVLLLRWKVEKRDDMSEVFWREEIALDCIYLHFLFLSMQFQK